MEAVKFEKLYFVILRSDVIFLLNYLSTWGELYSTVVDFESQQLPYFFNYSLRGG